MTTPLRAVVIGGSGQIGSWLLRVLAKRGPHASGTFATVPFPGLVKLDSADLDASATWVRNQKPDLVFYPAGFTWVDECERDPTRCRAANLTQPLNLARTAADVGARFVYFSTDYVFDGAKGPYDESATPNPLSEYGRAKHEAEIALSQALGDRALILRTTWVHGPERQGKNFAYQLVKALSAGKTLNCPSDQISSPSYGPDVALATVLLAEQGRSGLAHVSNPEILNRVDFARELAKGLGLDPGLIVGKTTAELGQTAARPLNSGLLTPKLNAWAPATMRPLSACLADFRERVRAGSIWANPFP
jgi:dTDP-4-dehydrorhamnose reductase